MMSGDVLNCKFENLAEAENPDGELSHNEYLEIKKLFEEARKQLLLYRNLKAKIIDEIGHGFIVDELCVNDECDFNRGLECDGYGKAT